jgi:hypothetical protein
LREGRHPPHTEEPAKRFKINGSIYHSNHAKSRNSSTTTPAAKRLTQKTINLYSFSSRWKRKFDEKTAGS